MTKFNNLLIDEEFKKNKYTVLFSLDPEDGVASETVAMLKKEMMYVLNVMKELVVKDIFLIEEIKELMLNKCIEILIIGEII